MHTPSVWLPEKREAWSVGHAAEGLTAPAPRETTPGWRGFRGLLSIILVTIWIYFLFLHGLGNRDLWNSHEARAAMDARSVLEDGSWPVPRLHDGRLELQKPPLYYWMVA